MSRRVKNLEGNFTDSVNQYDLTNFSGEIASRRESDTTHFLNNGGFKLISIVWLDDKCQADFKLIAQEFHWTNFVVWLNDKIIIDFDVGRHSDFQIIAQEFHRPCFVLYPH